MSSSEYWTSRYPPRNISIKKENYVINSTRIGIMTDTGKLAGVPLHYAIKLLDDGKSEFINPVELLKNCLSRLSVACLSCLPTGRRQIEQTDQRRGEYKVI